MERTTNFEEIQEKGEGFTWGEVIEVYTIREYGIIMIHPWKVEENIVKVGVPDSDSIAYHLYVRKLSMGYVSLNINCPTLDEALVTVIAIKYDGLNSQAAKYFFRGIGNRVQDDFHQLRKESLWV